MTRPPRILICDDELGVLEALREILRDQPYEALFVTNGPKALEIIKTQKIDLLLLDILMPKMSGVDVAKHLAKIKPKLKIIVITALAHKGIAMELYKYGVVDIVLKPFTTDKILQIIAKTLQQG